MKAILKYTSILMGLAMAVASCETVDYPDRFRETAGVPTVHYVRYADRDIVITQGFMEEVVCLVGENLTSVHDLYFNDQPAILNTSYMTANTLVVSVPKNLPKKQDDKIHLVTRDSSVVLFDFKVLPPVPKVETMSFEWAKPGDVVTITGSYFTTPFTVEFAGADPVEITSADGTSSFDVKIPAGALPGKVKVTTASGTGQSTFMYRDNRNILFSFDDQRGRAGNYWHAAKIETSDVALDGNYLLLYDAGGLKSDGTDWPDAGYHFEYWPGNWNTPETYEDDGADDLTRNVDFSGFSNMALKFEYMIPASDPWKGTPMQIWFAGHDLITLQKAGNTYFHDDAVSLPRAMWKPWLATGSYDTGGKWLTATFPISTDFIYYWDGSIAKGTLDANSFTGMEIFVAAGKENEGSPSAPKIYIDNIRVVPIK